MADQPQEQRRRLDATGSREVVYCHHCENDWYRDESGLICPRCESDITEIVSAGNDPRPPELPTPLSTEELRGLREHHPWEFQDNDSDPEVGDIRDFVRDNPPGRTTFISRSFRGSPREVFSSGSSRQPPNPDDPASQTLRDFEGIISGILGPNTRVSGGPPGEYPGSPFGPPGPRPGEQPSGAPPGTPPGWAHFRPGEAPADQHQQPRIFGSRITFQFGGPPPRAADAGANAGEGQGPQEQDLTTILRDLMLVLQPPGENGGANAPPGPLGGLQGLFAGLLNPANAVSGDAVYSQEALDRIISTLMEQHPTSNAPGPAPAEAIASLRKKKVDKEMLGPEGKAECSVCMDDVVLDEEVVTLPCSHWFHETCVTAWLSEHNTCPICRTGIARDGTAVPAGTTPPTSPPNASEQNNASGQNSPNPFEGVEGLPPYTRRSTFLRRRPSNNETRLASIRQAAGLDPENGLRMNPSSRRERSASPPSHVPGAFSSSNNRNTIFRRQESDTDAGSTSRRDRERELERERNRIHEGTADRSGGDRERPGSDHSNNSANSITGTFGSWFRRFSGGGNGRRNE